MWALVVTESVCITILCAGGSEKSKVGIGGDSGGGTVSSSVAHDVPGLAFEVSLILL